MKKYLLLILFAFGLSGCLGFGSSENDKSYDENLTSFVLQDNKQTILFIGKNHQYKFTNQKEISELFMAQKLLGLHSSNMMLDISVKEYQSSEITIRIYAHFIESQLSDEQIVWLEEHNYALEERMSHDANKSEEKPALVPTYVKHIEAKGKREDKISYQNSIVLDQMIILRVSEHIL